MIGKRIQHYEITEKLGEGGMGVVYKAQDTRLRRTVALKFLRPEIVDNPGEQERLVNEARAAAGLHHPNICTIHEINRHEGHTFIAMSYVEGSTLRDKVLSDRVDLSDALGYLIQIAQGLRQAHERDIVHRDIKSANIMIDRAGRAVIMDFGLARRSGPNQGEERVSSGGTSAYMSPEQARGEGVDQRTDIWSLGVVLYEMLAGQLPFRGDYEQAVIYSILNESPKPVGEFRQGIPAHALEIVEKCLEKQPDDRYQTLDELIAAVQASLARLRGGGRRRFGARRRALGLATAAVFTLAAAYLVVDFVKGRYAESEVRVPIAVIDFNNDTGEGEMDGLSGMLITALEQSRRLSVMTRTRMFDVLKTLGRDDVDRISESIGQEICRASGVEALVIPTIRKFGDLYTIDLKVLDTRNNRYIFTTKQDAKGQEAIPSMIDRIARDIRVDLKDERKAVDATEPVAEVTTVNLDAYQQYFEGEEYINDLELKKARESFKRAVELDSTFALAYYRLAYTEWWFRGALTGDAKKHVAKAMANIDRIPEKERYLVRALEAGLTEGFDAQLPIYKEMRRYYPDDKEMLFGLGDSEFHSANYDSAEVHFKRVLELDPEFDRALQHLTWTYDRTDRFAQAEETARKWVDVTHSVEAYASLSAARLMEGDADGAAASLKEAGTLHPESFIVHQQIAEVYLSTGRSDLAVSEMQGVMADENAGHNRVSAARVLAEAVYPYLGRAKDAKNAYDRVARLSASSGVDTTALLLSILGKANVTYWTSSNPSDCLVVAEETFPYPEQYKGPDYWKRLSVVYMVAGDVDLARETLHTKGDHFFPVERKIYDVLLDGFAGRCDAAMAIADSMGSDVVGASWGVYFVLGRCLYNAGDYDGAIAKFEKVVGEKRLKIGVIGTIAPAYFYMGRAYEAKGDAEHAIESYRKGLDVWKDADDGIPIRVDSQRRLDALLAAHTM